MEKVKVTKEQAKGLNQITTPQSAVKDYVGNWQLGNDLNALSLDELIRALYIGYEVEPEFEIGQWIVLTSPFTNAKITARILDIDVGGDNRVRLDRDDHCWWDKEDIRHATPEEIGEEKERRFFARHGKKPWELKRNDLIYSARYGLLAIANETELGAYWAYSYAGSNIHAISKKELKEDGYKVVCFAESRLDVKTNE